MVTKKFTLKDVLSMSFREYVEMYGKRMTDFRCVGVHAIVPETYMGSPLEELLLSIPSNAEALVNFSVHHMESVYTYEREYGGPEERATDVYIYSGDAVIPKSKYRKR